MDLAERMAVVEGRLERVERVLGLPGTRSASIAMDLPARVLATPRPGPRAEAARDLLEDPAATTRDGTALGAVPAGAPAPVTHPDPVR